MTHGSHSDQRSKWSTASLPCRRIYFTQKTSQHPQTRESEESTIPDNVGWKALQERLELPQCASELKLRLEPCCGDMRAIGKRMAQLDPGRAVFVGEIANVLVHAIDRDAVDDASDDRIKAQRCEELADVVDSKLWDRHVQDGGGWDRGGLPVGREESREIAGEGSTWDGNDGRTEECGGASWGHRAS